MKSSSLNEMVNDLRAETGQSVNAAHGQNTIEHMKRILRRTQDRLWEEFDWRHLRVYREFKLSSSTRFYAVPDGLTPERIRRAWVYYAGGWRELCFEIGMDEWSLYEPTAGETNWPIQRWDVSEDGHIEVWPVPSRGSGVDIEGTVRVMGNRDITPLVDGADKSEIHSDVIVLFAAAEMLYRQKSADAQAKADQANLLLHKLRSQQNKTSSFSFLDGGDREQETVRITTPMPRSR